MTPRAAVLCRLLTAALLVAALPLAAVAAAVPPAVESGSAAPRPLARGAAPAPEQRCTPDGRACITLQSYIPDVCRVIGSAAAENALDTGFFARLLWRESLFDAAAVSPAGAIGIAQFIPETAARRGLADPFNPAEAVYASAAYLADLASTFGNIGLAAVAYNGGEARAERFVARAGGLAPETRAYVQAITGHPAEVWRDTPPAAVDLALAGDGDFEARCVTLAATRSLREFETTPPLMPWGVVVASGRARDAAARQAERVQNRFATLIAGEPLSYSRGRRAGMPRSMHFAQIGRASRAEADALCARLQSAGADCMVISN